MERLTIGLKSMPKDLKPVELPPLEELLIMPMYQVADIDEVRKNGGENLKYIIDNAPLRNNKKYVSIWTWVQLLYPESSSINYNYNWHVDGDGLPFSNDEFILLISDCTARTEFAIHDYSVTVDKNIGSKDFHYLIGKMDFKGEKIPPSHYLNFTSDHPHRAVKPQKIEFRYMFRVCESDTFEPIKNGRMKGSYVYFSGERIKSIENRGDNIFIYNNEERSM